MEAQRFAQKHPPVSSDERTNPTTGLLQVPQQNSQRSRSFDSASGGDENSPFLDVPKRMQRRRSSSNSRLINNCIHCQYLEEYDRVITADKRYFFDHQEYKSLSYSDVSTSDDDDEEEEEIKYGNTLLPPVSPGLPTFILSPTNGEFEEFPILPIHGSPPMSPSVDVTLFDDPPPPANRSRRRSISRQEAVIVEPTGNSLENVTANTPQIIDSNDSCAIRTTEPEPYKSDDLNSEHSSTDNVQDIYLAVPDLKRDRAASVDSCFTKVSSAGKTEELQPIDGQLLLSVPNNGAIRSRSVDIVLPTAEQARYKALALAGPSGYRYV